MNIFNVNFKALGSILLPPRKRTKVMAEWLGALLTAIQVPWDNFYTVYWPDLLIRVKYNCQTIVLEAALNRIFGTSGITITNNGLNFPLTCLYNSSEGRGLYFFNQAEYSQPNYYYNRPEYLPAFDFTINVPSTAPLWDVAHAYLLNDNAKLNGVVFICVQANTGQRPSVAAPAIDTAYWHVLPNTNIINAVNKYCHVGYLFNVLNY